jgi:two-component system chemotaxis response regulator CheV
MSLAGEKNILLESGTNELEIVLFSVGTSQFGINVLKVREIIHQVEVTPVPNRHEHVKGIVRLRNEVIPVIDLKKVLHHDGADDARHDKYIIAELNQVKVAFHVEEVSRIHRISWEDIEKPNALSQGLEARSIGIVKMEHAMVFLLDYEKIISDISPDTLFDQHLPAYRPDRENTTVLIAEDSPVLKHLIVDTLTEAGYKQHRSFENGREAYEYLEALLADDAASSLPDLVITDIEMPQMDGHHLTKKIKDHENLRSLPVIIFSSLITADLFHKGEKVGADAQVSKPEINTLVKTIDSCIRDAAGR